MWLSIVCQQYLRSGKSQNCNIVLVSIKLLWLGFRIFTTFYVSLRISITFRRMDESKRPIWYTPEPDLLEIQPLSYEEDNGYRSNSPRSEPRTRRQSTRRVDNLETSGPSERSYSREARYSRSEPREPRDSTWRGRGSGSRWNHGRGRVNLGS